MMGAYHLPFSSSAATQWQNWKTKETKFEFLNTFRQEVPTMFCFSCDAKIADAFSQPNFFSSTFFVTNETLFGEESFWPFVTGDGTTTASKWMWMTKMMRKNECKCEKLFFEVIAKWTSSTPFSDGLHPFSNISHSHIQLWSNAWPKIPFFLMISILVRALSSLYSPFWFVLATKGFVRKLLNALRNPILPLSTSSPVGRMCNSI